MLTADADDFPATMGQGEISLGKTVVRDAANAWRMGHSDAVQKKFQADRRKCGRVDF
ncbi:hypothetical protein ACQR1W_01205 [Bradyrhizobium sp. HKCCYLS1011]|uniref:hypothetical protein n=1 Tax=Bradyrhizobium sp. HKCCYLS1011 TaxID=3420733 RepID=UPI003EB9E90A